MFILRLHPANINGVPFTILGMKNGAQKSLVFFLLSMPTRITPWITLTSRKANTNHESRSLAEPPAVSVAELTAIERAHTCHSFATRLNCYGRRIVSLVA
jgi:hypothetical protein